MNDDNLIIKLDDDTDYKIAHQMGFTTNIKELMSKLPNKNTNASHASAPAGYPSIEFIKNHVQNGDETMFDIFYDETQA